MNAPSGNHTLTDIKIPNASFHLTQYKVAAYNLIVHRAFSLHLRTKPKGKMSHYLKYCNLNTTCLYCQIKNYLKRNL